MTEIIIIATVVVLWVSPFRPVVREDPTPDEELPYTSTPYTLAPSWSEVPRDKFRPQPVREDNPAEEDG
jgi:hypothetical protein